MTETSRTVRYFHGQYIDEGYEFIGVGENNGWKAVSAWGADGWDLGDWPYVVYLVRNKDDKWQVCCYVEGDITIDTYDTRQAMIEALDQAAHFYWRNNGILTTPEGEPVPDRFKGPYSSDRS